MHLLDTENVVVTKPTKEAVGATVGYAPQATAGETGAPLSADLLNTLLDELKNLVELGGGYTLSKTDDAQVLATVGALRSHVSAVTAASSYLLRAVLASNTCTASGAASATVGARTSDATGAESVVAASLTCKAEGDQSAVVASENANASGDRSAVIASVGATSAPDVNIDGDVAVIIASIGDNTDQTTIGVNGSQAAIIGCDDVSIIDCDRVVVGASKVVDIDTTGANAAAFACLGLDVTTAASQVFAAACGTDGTNWPELAANYQAAIGVRGNVKLTGGDLVVLASAFDVGGSALDIAENNTVCGGKDAEITWKLASETGRATLKLLSLTAVPSGATQVGAGASADEVWVTASHATLPDGVLMLGS